MFYKQFLNLTDAIDVDIIENIDFWLGTLPDNKTDNISTSFVASKFSISFTIAEIILAFASKEEILDKQYLIVCPNEECNLPYKTVDADELITILNTKEYCHNCEEEYIINYSNVYIVYRRKHKPDVPEHIIKEEILKRLNIGIKSELQKSENFLYADSLSENIEEIYDLYFKPSESAYIELKKLKDALDYDYSNTTAKGEAYEILVLKLFNCVKFMTGTNKLRTYTNQFDCTIMSPFTTNFTSIFQKLTPYFIVECKNEIKTTPSNTYFHKLSDIMSTNESQVGIVCSRKPPSNEDMQIAFQQYLLNRNLTKQRYLISISDEDLISIIEDKVNLLKLIDIKILEMTTNARNATYNMFNKKE